MLESDNGSEQISVNGRNQNRSDGEKLYFRSLHPAMSRCEIITGDHWGLIGITGRCFATVANTMDLDLNLQCANMTRTCCRARTVGGLTFVSTGPRHIYASTVWLPVSASTCKTSSPARSAWVLVIVSTGNTYRNSRTARLHRSASTVETCDIAVTVGILAYASMAS